MSSLSGDIPGPISNDLASTSISRRDFLKISGLVPVASRLAGKFGMNSPENGNGIFSSNLIDGTRFNKEYLGAKPKVDYIDNTTVFASCDGMDRSRRVSDILLPDIARNLSKETAGKTVMEIKWMSQNNNANVSAWLNTVEPVGWSDASVAMGPPLTETIAMRLSDDEWVLAYATPEGKVTVADSTKFPGHDVNRFLPMKGGAADGYKFPRGFSDYEGIYFWDGNKMQVVAISTGAHDQEASAQPGAQSVMLENGPLRSCYKSNDYQFFALRTIADGVSLEVFTNGSFKPVVQGDLITDIVHQRHKNATDEPRVLFMGDLVGVWSYNHSQFMPTDGANTQFTVVSADGALTTINLGTDEELLERVKSGFGLNILIHSDLQEIASYKLEKVDGTVIGLATCQTIVNQEHIYKPWIMVIRTKTGSIKIVEKNLNEFLRQIPVPTVPTEDTHVDFS